MVWVSFTAGLQDGFNPCMLTTGAVMLALYLWLERKGIRPQRPLIAYIAAVFAFGLALNLGFGARFFASRVFQKAAIGGYFVLAVAFLVLGTMFFYNWVKNRI